MTPGLRPASDIAAFSLHELRDRFGKWTTGGDTKPPPPRPHPPGLDMAGARVLSDDELGRAHGPAADAERARRADHSGQYVQLWHGTSQPTARAISHEGLRGTYSTDDPTLSPDRLNARLLPYEMEGSKLSWPANPAAVLDVRVPAAQEHEYLYPPQGPAGFRALRKPLPPDMIYGHKLEPYNDDGSNPRRAAAWDEARHPRGYHGRFGHGQGGKTPQGFGWLKHAIGLDSPVNTPVNISGTDPVHVDDVAEASKAAHIVPGLLHGSHEEWNGTVGIYPQGGRGKNVLAEMDWDGTLLLQQDVARALSEDRRHPGAPMEYPDAHEIELHEFIHGTVPDGSAAANQAAYQDFAHAEIEEGFTELGGTQHAPEFFRATGIADRPTTTLKEGRAYYTAGELADELRRPSHISAGEGWGHYPDQTAEAQQWVMEVAKAEGHGDFEPGQPGYARMVELTDEINRQGAGSKVPAMGVQMLRAVVGRSAPPGATVTPPDDAQAIVRDLVGVIKDAWSAAPGTDRGGKAAVAATALIRRELAGSPQ